jgi:hypothetical protein
MNDQSRNQLNGLMAHIEENWANLNALFDDLAASDGWSQKHGPDWIFADLPYHLAYCNQEILIRGVKAGPDLPEAQQELLPTVPAINDWNARKFAERPADQTAEQSVAQWRDTCAEIRRLASEMSDADLQRPFFMPLMTGWVVAQDGFKFVRNHDCGEFMQLRLHMGRDEPVSSAGLTRAYLASVLGFFPLFLNREAAAGRTFTAVMAFTNPGVGAFTLTVKDGSAELKEGAAPDADLLMTQSAESYIKTLNGMHDPAAAIQSGEIRVNDFEALATFGQLFQIG